MLGPDFANKKMMTSEVATREKELLRQYWLRVLLSIGLLWGTMPLITIGLVIVSWKGPRLILAAMVCNAFTVLPGCALAFWHRRTACVWLSANAVLAVVALVISVEYPDPLNLPEIAALGGPVVIAGFLDFMEIKRWPGALGR